MPPLAHIELIGPDPQSASPRFRFDIGSNTQYRLDVGTLATLASNQGPTTFQFVMQSHAGGGPGEITFPPGLWRELQSAPIYYYRLLSWGVAMVGTTEIHHFEPELRAVEPPTGSTAGGAVVSLIGVGLGTAAALPAVVIGGSPAASVRFGTRGFVEAVVPPGVAGDATIELRSAAGAAVRIAASAQFRYRASIASVRFGCPYLDAPLWSSLRLEDEWDINVLEQRFTIEALARDGAGNLQRPQGASEIELAVVGSAAANQWQWCDDTGQPLAGPLRLIDGVGYARLRVSGSLAGERVEIHAKADQIVVGQRLLTTRHSADTSEWEIEVLPGATTVVNQLSDLQGPAGPLRYGGVVARNASNTYLMTGIGQIEMRPHDLYLGTDHYERNPFDATTTHVPYGMMVLLLVRVHDRARNAIPIDLGEEDAAYRLQLELPATASTTSTIPFVLGADGHGQLQKTTYFELRRIPGPLPIGVTAAFLMPAFRSLDSATTWVTLRVMRHAREPNGSVAVNDLGVSKTFAINASPSPDNARFSRWFFDGDVQGVDQFAAEIGLSLIPVVGDGRDLLVYGRQLISGKPLSDIDHVVAVLAVIGIVGDIVTIATAGAGVVVDAPIAVMKTSFKLLRSLRKPERGRRLAAVLKTWFAEFFTLPTIRWEFPDLDTLRASASFAKLAESVVRLAHLGRRLSNADPQHVMQFLSLLGVVVTEVAMLDAVLGLAEHYDLPSMMDMLYTSAALDDEDLSELV